MISPVLSRFSSTGPAMGQFLDGIAEIQDVRGASKK